jgi:hypothetical protein
MIVNFLNIAPDEIIREEDPVKLKRMTFPLIAALAIAGAAQAEADKQKQSDHNGRAGEYSSQVGKSDKDNNGNAYGHDKQGKDAEQAKRALYKASLAYKNAWKHPSKEGLYGAFKEYRQAALAAHEAGVDGDGALSGRAKIDRYFAAEADRIESYFHDMRKLSKILEDFRQAIKGITMSVVDSDEEELRASLKKKYAEASRLLDNLDDGVDVKETKKDLQKAYEEALKHIEKTKTKLERSTKGVEKVKGAGSAEIDTHSVCKIATNSDGRQIFVSARTKEEWASDNRSFLKNLPKGVTAADCPPPPPPPRDDDKDKPNYQKKGYDLGDGRKGKCDDEKCD